MRIAVTGGAGFIGRATCKKIEELGHDPVVVDRAHGHDVTAPEGLRVLNGCQAVIHLAGVLGTSELFDAPRKAITVNIVGTLNVLEACAQGGLAYVGITMPDSNWPSVYQATKLGAVRLASAYHHAYKVPVTHIRAFNVYGPGQAYGPGHPQKLVPTFASLSWQKKPMPIWGDGRQTVDLVHVDHVAQMLARSVLSPGSDETYDAGSGEALTVLEVSALIGLQTGSIAADFLPMRPGETHQTHICAKDPGPFGFDTFNPARFAQVVESYRPGGTT